MSIEEKSYDYLDTHVKKNALLDRVLFGLKKGTKRSGGKVQILKNGEEEP